MTSPVTSPVKSPVTTARRGSLAALALVGVMALGACASEPAATPTSTPTSTPTASSTPTATPSPSATPSTSAPAEVEWPTPETISCDTMIDATAASALRDQGFESFPKEFTQFGFPYTLAALECPWGLPDDYHPHAYYAWAQFAPGERDAFVALVEENNYTLEETERGAWLVERADQPSVDNVAVLVTEEWVAFADSREQIDDIVWTR